jgi:hypothetical protein
MASRPPKAAHSIVTVVRAPDMIIESDLSTQQITMETGQLIGFVISNDSSDEITSCGNCEDLLVPFFK